MLKMLLLTGRQVAERSLSLWNNEYFISLLTENAAVMMPILFPALYVSSKTHWHRSIHALVYHALKILMEINGPLFDECSHRFKVRARSARPRRAHGPQATQQQEKQKEEASEAAWAKLEALAAKNPLAKTVWRALGSI